MCDGQDQMSATEMKGHIDPNTYENVAYASGDESEISSERWIL